MSRRLEISDNGRIIYAQDVDEYSLEFDSTELRLSASHNLPRDPNAPTVRVNDGPPIELTTTITSVPPGPVEQLGDLESLTPPDGEHPTEAVLEVVHTGDRNPANERRTKSRKPAGGS